MVGEEDSAPVTRSGNVRRTSGGLVNQHRPTRFKQQAAAAAAARNGEAVQDAAEGQPSQMSQDSQGSDGGRLAAAGTAGAGPSSGPPAQEQQQWRRQQQQLLSGSAGPASGGSGSLSDAMRRRRASLEPSSCCAALYYVRGHTCTVLDGCLRDDPSQCISLCVRSFTGIEVGGAAELQAARVTARSAGCCLVWGLCLSQRGLACVQQAQEGWAPAPLHLDCKPDNVATCLVSFTNLKGSTSHSSRELLVPLQRWFYLNRALACGCVFETYCDRMGISLGSVKFLYKGTRIFGADTPEALQVGRA
jgi:hypothetical protein